MDDHFQGRDLEQDIITNACQFDLKKEFGTDAIKHLIHWLS